MRWPPRLLRDSAAGAGAALIGNADPSLVRITVALAALTAVLDRVAVLQILDASSQQASVWWTDATWIAVLIGAVVLAGRWARVAGLGLAERASDNLLLRYTRRVLAADWSDVASGSPANALSSTAKSIQDDASKVALALPAILVLPVTAIWLSLREPGALALVMIVAVAGAALLRHDVARIRAGETVVAQAEAAFDIVLKHLLDAARFLRLSNTPALECLDQAVWPVVDDATRAASLLARITLRVAVFAGWLSILVIIVLLAFAPATLSGSLWLRALILVAATLPHARHAGAAYLALGRLGAAAARLDAMFGRLPEAETATAVAPARWQEIEFRSVRVRERETAAMFVAAIGPLDITLRRGEIVALSGPDQAAEVTLLHVMCGLIAPDSGAVLLDGRPILPRMLRGLSAGVLDASVPPGGSSQGADGSRLQALLTRFDLPPSIVTPAEDNDAAASLTESERVRLAIVLAELEDRSIRVYDQRYMHLEPRFREAFADTLRDARRRGHTCILATANPGLLAIADRVLQIRDGVLERIAETAE